MPTPRRPELEPELEEGWYLMNTAELERALARLRGGDDPVVPPTAVRLSIDAALAYRDAGNLPDDEGRTLRLVLRIRNASDLESIHDRRLRFEPDHHEAPEWRRRGSVPVNVIPLRPSQFVRPDPPGPWWRRPELARLEQQWQTSGAIDGLRIPAELRGFVYKTILALRAAGIPVTVGSVSDSIQRWTPVSDAERIRQGLEDANR